MSSVCLVELGSGCCHGINPTKAAVRACNDAIEWNSVKVLTIIPGGYEAMLVHVQIAVPRPSELDLGEIASCFPYGRLLPIVATEGGMLGSSRAGLPADEPSEAMMTVANVCVTVGFGKPMAFAEPVAATATVPSPPSRSRRELRTSTRGKKFAARAAAYAARTSSAAPTIPSPPPPPPPPPPSPPPPPPQAPQEPQAPLTRQTTGTTESGRLPTAEEMTPGSADMLARAATAKARWPDAVLTPYEAFALIGDEVQLYIGCSACRILRVIECWKRVWQGSRGGARNGYGRAAVEEQETDMVGQPWKSKKQIW